MYQKHDQIDENLLKNYLSNFERIYKDNPLLYTSLGKMLLINEKNRPDFVKLKDILPDYAVIKEYFSKN